MAQGLTLAAFRGKVTHQVFVGITQQVVTVGPVLREVQCRIFKNGDQIGQPFDLFLAVTQLGGIVEVGHVRQLVGLSQRPQNLLVDLVANVG